MSTIILKIYNKAIRFIRNNVYMLLFNGSINSQLSTSDGLGEKIKIKSLPIEKSLRENFGERESYEVISLSSALIMDSIGFIKIENKWITWTLVTLNYKKTHKLLPLRRFFKFNPDKKHKKVTKSLILPGYAWNDNYYHWITEILPVICLGNRIDNDEVLIAIPENLNSFQQKSIEYLDIDPTRILKLKKGITYLPQEILIFKEIRTWSNFLSYSLPDSFATKLTRDTILAKLKVDSKSLRKLDILWISRSATGNRKVANELEIINALTARGYIVERIIPEQVPFEEQINRIRHAKIVIGPHGAGLTNIIWSNCQLVIELVGQKKINNSFSSLCYALSKTHVIVYNRSLNKFLGNRSDIITSADMIFNVINKHYSY